MNQIEKDRVFLVVIDDSPELEVALRYACRRARHTEGRVALLYVIEPPSIQNWMGVDALMRTEARETAEQTLYRLANRVYELSGELCTLYIREGNRAEQLLQQIDEDPSISILVLGANTGRGGPGPLITALTGKFISKLRIPLTIVPDALSEADIDALS